MNDQPNQPKQPNAPAQPTPPAPQPAVPAQPSTAPGSSPANPPQPPTPLAAGAVSPPAPAAQSPSPTPQAAPVQQQPPKKRKTWLLALILIVLIALIGGGTWAYFAGYVPFFQRNLEPEEVIDRMLGSITEIKSAAYDAKIEFKSEPRDPGARTWEEIMPEFKETKTALERDKERLADMRDIQSAIRNYFLKHKIDPVSLADLANEYPAVADKITDPHTGQPYGYRQEEGGSNFILHVQMETPEAIEKYSKGVRSSGAEPVIRQGKVIEASKDTPNVYAYVDEDSAAPYPVNLGIDDVYQYLPVEVKAMLAVSGQTETDVSKTNNASYSMSGELALGGMSFNAAAELRKIGEDYYGRINEAPSLGFFDLAALKGKWVKADPQDAQESVLGEALQQSGEDGIDEKGARLIRQYQVIMQQLQEDDLIQVVKEYPREEEEDGDSLYHYQIKLDRGKLPGFYEKLTRKLESQFGNDAAFKFNEETADYLKSEEFTNIYAALDENVALELWVDGKNFWPKKISYSQRMVPPTSIKKLENIQYRLTLATGLDKINEAVTVETPANAISVEEAQALMSGMPANGSLMNSDTEPAETGQSGYFPALANARANTHDARIKSDVGQMRTLAEVYFDENNQSYVGFDKCVESPSEATCDAVTLDAVKNLLEDLAEGYGQAELAVNTSATEFCISHPLPSGGYACIDATGSFSKVSTVNCGEAALSCPQ